MKGGDVTAVHLTCPGRLREGEMDDIQPETSDSSQPIDSIPTLEMAPGAEIDPRSNTLAPFYIFSGGLGLIKLLSIIPFICQSINSPLKSCQ